MILEIQGIPVELIRKPIKSINLRIYPPDGAVKMTAPLRFSERLLRQHLEAKSDWIVMQRERIMNSGIPIADMLQTGSTVLFLGEPYFLMLHEHNGPAHIKIQEGVMYFYVAPNASEIIKQKFLDQWYRRELAALLPELITHWEKVVGVKVEQWGIKKMKTRWGSCNTRASRIWLNLSLIKKPIRCLEYVLVHELVHLHEASHNKRFYALMSQFMPEWKEHQVVLEGNLKIN